MSDGEQVSLREFIERIMNERDKALGIATDNLEKRLDMLNELRGDVLTKGEWNATHYPLADRVTKLENWQAKIVGGGLLLIAISGTLGALIAYFAKLK